MAGAFFETYVVGEVVKSIRNAGTNPASSVFYYRDKDNREIDLLIVREGKLYPIEIKKGVNPIKPNKNFHVLEKYKMPVMPGVIIDSTDRLHPINENAWACPVSLIGF